MTLRTAPERMTMRMREEPDDTRRSATPVRIFFASVVTGLYDGDVGCIEENYAQLLNKVFPVIVIKPFPLVRESVLLVSQ